MIPQSKIAELSFSIYNMLASAKLAEEEKEFNLKADLLSGARKLRGKVAFQIKIESEGHTI